MNIIDFISIISIQLFIWYNPSILAYHLMNPRHAILNLWTFHLLLLQYKSKFHLQWFLTFKILKNCWEIFYNLSTFLSNIIQLLVVENCWNLIVRNWRWIVNCQKLTNNSGSSTAALSRLKLSTLHGPDPPTLDYQKLRRSGLSTKGSLTITIPTIIILNINLNVQKELLSEF